MLQYNDPAGLEAAFAAHGSRIAGVIFEPIVGNMGLVVPTPEFLASVATFGILTDADADAMDERFSKLAGAA